MIVLEGVEALFAAADKKVAQMSAATRIATGRALHLIERNAKKELSTSSHRANEPTPSAPGEPPSLVTGNLRRSITVTGPEKIGLDRWRGSVGPTAVYGRIQELGGVTGRNQSVTLPARPYMRPGFDKSTREIGEIFRKLWAGAVLK